MKKALLIIDAQKSVVENCASNVLKEIEKLQEEYERVFISLFESKKSPLLDILGWDGYEDEKLAIEPKEEAVIFIKSGYSSYFEEMKIFDEVHLVGFDTDACVYKTALDLVENGIRPVVLKDLCFSENKEFHEMGIRLLERNIGKHNVI